MSIDGHVPVGLARCQWFGKPGAYRDYAGEAATQNQALSALLFLYAQVLEIDLPWLEGMVRAKRPVRLPVVRSEAELRALLGELEGTRWLMASLLYGAGLRLRDPAEGYCGPMSPAPSRQPSPAPVPPAGNLRLLRR